MINPPAPWTNQGMSVYHGTLLPHAQAIVFGGVRVANGRVGTDFGPGFYTTTELDRAKSWAWNLAQQVSGSTAAVVRVSIARDSLAHLDSLAFVRGDRTADDYWSLIVHCRNGAVDHARKAPNASYDVVYGPVSAFWQQRIVMLGGDQVSFHTVSAEHVLNAPATRRSVVWSKNP